MRTPRPRLRHLQELRHLLAETMRNMSFALTTPQYKDRSKTVTRRFAWWFLKPGDRFMGVKKGMGLKRGEKVQRLHPSRVISTRGEPLNSITQEDVIKEGFPGWSPAEYVKMMMDHHRCAPDAICNRIEFVHE